ncbi:MAG: prolyl oligopeptidase family serine peptidase [Candidatus Amulumruptor caecigallinarius]|nr:prolyl oligopeptidase family serine peptidase [Candidatus Amulumruptor caecigallinarius]
MKKSAISVALTALLLCVNAISAEAEKKMLGHDDFDSWKSVKNHEVSRNGEWAAFSVNPQEGDGVLTFYNSHTGKRMEIARGYNPRFTADGKWGVALIKPLFAATRMAKIAKKKDADLPRDSLAVVNLSTGVVKRIGDVTEYKIGKDAGQWIAFKSCDTTLVKQKYLKDKECGRPLVAFNPETGAFKVINWVKDYTFSRDGKRIAVNTKKPEKDSVATNCIGVLNLPDTSFTVIDRDKKFYGIPAISEQGNRLAYTASNDTVKSGTKRADVYLSDLDNIMRAPREIKLEFNDKAGQNLYPNQYTRLKFSHNGKRLIAGVAPVIAPDDTTIVDFEKGKLDIWVWNKALNPPQEQKQLDKIRENNFPVVIDLDNFSKTLITDEPLAEVKAPNRWDGDYALVLDPTSTIVSYQWDYFAPTEMYVVNVKNGEKKLIGRYQRSNEPQLSPADKYVAWFADRNYYVYDIASGETVCASGSVPYPLWDTDDRHPSPADPYGIAGWGKDDEALLIYDKHDIWSIDPKGDRKPVCVTSGEGRKQNVKYRYRNLDPDRRFLSSGDIMLLNVFSYTTKYNGLAIMKYGETKAPATGVLDKYAYTQIRKALDADVYTWQRANFNTSPDMWLSRGTRFAQAVRLSDANPQMKDYSWGTAQLERWYAYDGNMSEGVLYVPEDYDPSKKYPMMCVFYETGSEDLCYHYTMEPSWSWVNYPFYVSRGYVVFVPDIHYTSGRPGEDAYNYVCSGVEEMCRRYPWIDKSRIGIDGQSWGGYQTAYLVTRTNMFACAGSGAPVANMTSAYGGIRWESGDSRQPQYEQGQSRIGGTLWERPEMYIQSSPVFHADRCETPLLIMHNDNDGAVPWYQGIELFMALRRLQKPVWMLQYNGESHNIRERKNRKDITRRFQQFFDHYLKGEPMPKWMKEGVPMIRKGQEWGFETEESGYMSTQSKVRK